VEDPDRLILEKAYESHERHLVVCKSSVQETPDSLRACLNSIVSKNVRDLVLIVENSPD
jgi:hypothetical protein